MNLNSDFLFLFSYIFLKKQKNLKPQKTHKFTHADSDYEPPIYYFGDKNVTLGEPFSITCFININEPVRWLKDGESITRHNLRHGRDEHSYRVSEFPIEGKFFFIFSSSLLVFFCLMGGEGGDLLGSCDDWFWSFLGCEWG